MWQSPINIECIVDKISKQIDEQRLEYVMKVVHRTVVDVDERELLLALNYDRNQYEIGYKEGYREAIENVRNKLKEIDVEFNYLDSLLSENIKESDKI